jgi:predicted RNase H-like HicB family nuclease
MPKVKRAPTPERSLKSYTFRIVIEKDRWPDEPDEKAIWAAYCPALLAQGASTWGATKEEALKNIQEVLQMVIESLVEHGESIPEQEAVTVSEEPLVTVTIAR